MIIIIFASGVIGVLYLFPSVAVGCFVVPLQLNADDAVAVTQKMMSMKEMAVRSPVAHCVCELVHPVVLPVVQAVGLWTRRQLTRLQVLQG